MQLTLLLPVAGSIAGITALLALFLILNPKFQDGFLIRLGLSFCTVGFGAAGLHLLDPGLRAVTGIGAAVSTGLLGFLFVGLGYTVRIFLAGHQLRRKSDWISGEKGVYNGDWQ
jgi:hypothetical protein